MEEVLKELREIKELLKQSFINPSWEFRIKKSEEYTIRRGRSESIFLEKGIGAVAYILATLNSPNAIVEFKLDQDYVRSSIQELYASGLTSWNPSMFWIVKYDSNYNIYIVALTPSYPRYYYGRVEVLIHAPPDEDVSLSYVVHYYKYRGW